MMRLFNVSKSFLVFSGVAKAGGESGQLPPVEMDSDKIIVISVAHVAERN